MINEKILDKALKKLGSSLKEFKDTTVGRSGPQRYISIMTWETPEDVISSAFSWPESPQGFSFWSEISARINEVYAVEKATNTPPEYTKRGLLRKLTQGYRIKGKGTQKGCFYYLDKNAKIFFYRASTGEHEPSLYNTIDMFLYEWLDVVGFKGTLISRKPYKRERTNP